MSKTCVFTGRVVGFGNQKTYRGKAKYLGGVGKKITGTSRRVFKPNLQRVQAVVEGETKRIRACVQCIRSGRVQRPIKVKAFSTVNV
ncbi:MAG TPA: 50S ribosomal protein L28 [Gemmataceae bacterium]|nr:50S ribosomal protein L28 [Gemmataceae bacterium]